MLVCPNCGEAWLKVTLAMDFLWVQCPTELLQADKVPQPQSIRPDTPVECEECGWKGLERDLDESK